MNEVYLYRLELKLDLESLRSEMAKNTTDVRVLKFIEEEDL